MNSFIQLSNDSLCLSLYNLSRTRRQHKIGIVTCPYVGKYRVNSSANHRIKKYPNLHVSTMFVCTFIDISTLDNANLRNEMLVKVGRKAACIIAYLCNTVEDIHRAKKCVQTFRSDLR